MEFAKLYNLSRACMISLFEFETLRLSMTKKRSRVRVLIGRPDAISGGPAAWNRLLAELRRSARSRGGITSMATSGQDTLRAHPRVSQRQRCADSSRQKRVYIVHLTLFRHDGAHSRWRDLRCCVHSREIYQFTAPTPAPSPARFTLQRSLVRFVLKGGRIGLSSESARFCARGSYRENSSSLKMSLRAKICCV